MEKLNQNTVTLARNNEVSVGSVIVWHSSDLTLDANFNLQSFSSTLVLQEQLIGEALRFANEHASLLAREIALNQQNVVAESNIVAKIENTFCTEMYNRSTVGSISELYDSAKPYEAKGAFAQAWSVAEIFRIIIKNHEKY